MLAVNLALLKQTLYRHPQKLNVLQRRGLAEALGVGVDELGSLIRGEPVKVKSDPLINSNTQLIEVLEPWCSNMYCDDKLGKHYITVEQLKTSFHLNERVLPYDNEKQNGILEFSLRSIDPLYQ